MAQKYRIYINEKVILVTDSVPKKLQAYEKIDADAFDLKIVYTWVLANSKDMFFILCDDPKSFLQTVKKSLPLIEAAGGLVENENNEYLFIFRNGKWDIAKGKIEKKERVKQAAVREVEEECGIKVNSIEKKICNTYHSYVYKGEVVLKKTHWFNMRSKGQNKLKPQKEEGITEARWLKKEGICLIADNTYPSIMDVLKKKRLV